MNCNHLLLAKEMIVFLSQMLKARISVYHVMPLLRIIASFDFNIQHIFLVSDSKLIRIY